MRCHDCENSDSCDFAGRKGACDDAAARNACGFVKNDRKDRAAARGTDKSSQSQGV